MTIRSIRESYTCPADAQSYITRAGGRNIYNDPNYRIVWGRNRLDYRDDLRYWGLGDKLDRWMVEVWTPPWMYGTPESWESKRWEEIDGIKRDLLGPFPSRGDYELVTTIGNSEFVQLTPTVIELVVDLVRKSRGLTDAERKINKEAIAQQRDYDYDHLADAVLDDASGAFYNRPFVTFSDKANLPSTTNLGGS